MNIEGRTFVGDTPKTLYPKGSQSDWLFNIEKCDRTKPLILTEGIKDLCKIWNVDHNVVSCFGGNITQAKVDLLLKLGFTDIIIFADNDPAGFHMLDQFDRLFPHDFRVCMNDIPGGDPNDLTLRQIKYKLDRSEEYGKFLMDKMRTRKDINEYW